MKINQVFSRFFDKSKVIQIDTDIHAHLIPNIDDGPQTINQSVFLIKELINLGYKRLYATPHVYQEYYPNDRLDILAGFELLKRTIDRLKLNVELFPAAEYFLDKHFLSLLKKKEVLPIADNYLLVEDAFMERKELIENYIFQIRVSGYQPILAHPERYLHLAKNKERFDKLKEMGCLFQLNILSLSGYYGMEAKRLAKYLLRRGYINFIGTDLHNKQQIKLIQQFKETSAYRNLVSKHPLRNNEIIAKPILHNI